MRCPDCNKFVSFDTETEPEVNISVDDDGHVSGDVRIVNTCAECGTEMKEATFSVDSDLSTAVKEHKAESEEKEHSLSADMEDLSRTDHRQAVDRRGKPIRNPRYQKQMYGAEGTITLECSCGWAASEQWHDEVQASGMEELV